MKKILNSNNIKIKKFKLKIVIFYNKNNKFKMIKMSKILIKYKIILVKFTLMKTNFKLIIMIKIQEYKKEYSKLVNIILKIC